jgi:hypothetical protein
LLSLQLKLILEIKYKNSDEYLNNQLFLKLNTLKIPDIMKLRNLLPAFILFSLVLFKSCIKSGVVMTGELRKWHTLTLTFNGPDTDENAEPNPFTDYRLLVTFTHDSAQYKVPGFYAANGNAAETGAENGNKWQVRFTPDHEGTWTYRASFRQGKNIAVSDEPDMGSPVFFDGDSGTFKVGPTNKTGNDFRGKGRLRYTGKRYLQFAETREYFLKGGADSPENFLAYEDFDSTSYKGDSEQRMGEAAPLASLHQYKKHIRDWATGDPVWKGGKGKAIIGALNYLASRGMNSVYFLTMNIGGDGRDVWPYTDYEERLRFDCSKLDQWEKVFAHMDKLGIMLHVVTQETENELLLDSGNTDLERKLYYRELIARFGHHLAITWNMGEENGYADFTTGAQTTEQQKDMIKYMKQHDPYKNFVVLHTHSNPRYRYAVLDNLLGFKYLDGPSIQIKNPLNAHKECLTWIQKSGKAGKQWIVNIDEIGPNWRGVDPDDRIINNQDTVRKYVLWACLMAGGGGAEWYFGFKNHNNDLGCEDWRSRERMWDYTRIAIEFFRNYLPFAEMEPADGLTDNPSDYCLAQPGKVYAIYLPFTSDTKIDLTQEEETFELMWYNPRKGGNLLKGSVARVTGGKSQFIGNPPADPHLDWTVLLRQ